MKRMLIAGLLTEEEAEPAVQRRKPAWVVISSSPGMTGLICRAASRGQWTIDEANDACFIVRNKTGRTGLCLLLLRERARATTGGEPTDKR